MKNQQRFFLALAGTAIPVMILLWCCTKPTKDFVININSNIITYTATFDFTDARTGSVPSGLSITVDGPDADAIYDYSGTKELKLTGGKVTIGVHPHNVPTGSTTLSFNIKATSTNYLPVNVPVVIGSDNKNQNFDVPLININTPPDGVATRQQTNTINAGTSTSTIAVATTANASASTTASITIPAGTQFRNAANTPISGNSVNSVLASFDPDQPVAKLSLPGGQAQTAVSGGPSPSVFFLPAGFATVILKVGNTEVKNFSQAVGVQIGLNDNAFNPTTNATLKAGDVLDIYSYQVETGIWKFEQAATVTSSGGHLYANFNTTHLCTFLANIRSTIRSCTARRTITFNAPSINEKSSEQFIVDIYPTGTGNNPAPLISQYVTIHDKESITYSGFMAGSINIKISQVDYDHYQLRDYNNRGAQVATQTLNLCSAPSTTTININYAPGTYLSGTGRAVCANDNTKVYLPADGAQVYYKKSGTTDKLRILGVIVDQAITTSQLVVGQRYDIKGNYSGKQVGRNNILIRTGVSFMDSTLVVTSGSGFCP